MERVQTQFLICRTGGCSFGSVGLIFAHVARFWDVGPALAPYWAMLSHFCGFCWPLLGKSWDHIGLVLGHFGLCWDILGHVGQELGPYWACLGTFWAMLGHFGPCWSHIGLILGHFVLFSDLSRPLFWTRAFQRR